MKKQYLQTTNFIVSKNQMELDLKMIRYDLWGTIVHVLMLHKQNIITNEKAKKILGSLIEIEDEVSKGKFAINPNLGLHLSIEAKVVEKIGDTGYSMHVARSRNDQVMVTELLYLKEKMLDVITKLLSVLKTLFDQGQKYEKTIMPGYTHMQPAKPTTVGQWALSYFFAFSRAGESIKNYFETYNKNPLGSVEGYGATWKIDRNYTAPMLGFNSVWEVPQDVVSSRGIAQYNFLHTLSEICINASKIAQDLILFNTFEFGIVELGEEVSQRMHPITGSSVMAQKKNPDVLELIRANSPQVIGYVSIVGNLLSSLPFAYNRDSREVKEYMEMGLSKTSETLDALGQVLETIKWNDKRMMELVMENYSLTTDLADAISQTTGIGYRIIYKILGQVVDEAIQKNKPISSIKALEIIQKAKGLGVELNITDKQIEQMLNVQNIVAKRYPRPQNKKLYKQAKKIISKLDNWNAKQVKTINDAYTKTHNLVSFVGAIDKAKGV